MRPPLTGRLLEHGAGPVEGRRVALGASSSRVTLTPSTGVCGSKGVVRAAPCGWCPRFDKPLPIAEDRGGHENRGSGTSGRTRPSSTCLTEADGKRRMVQVELVA